jgi:hypothetical protein
LYRWFTVHDADLVVEEKLVGAAQGSLWTTAHNTSRGDVIHLSSTLRLYDQTMLEVFDQNSTARLHLTAPDGQSCSLSGDMRTSLADLYGDLDYSGQKYLLDAGLRFDNESFSVARNFTMPPFFPNLCPLPHGVKSSDHTRAPTVRPTARPTAPTAKPTAAPSSFKPSPVPTQNPSINPTQNPNYTNKPTAAPTRTPTRAPSVHATAAPTVTPSRVPTRVPTVTKTAAPTIRPSIRPTPAPSTSAPTLDRSSPVIERIEVSVARTTISLNTKFTKAAVYAGTVYCAAYAPGMAVDSARAIITANNAKSSSYLAGALNTTVTMTGLFSMNNYTTYCATVTIHGDTSSSANVVATAKNLKTACCKLITFSNSPTAVYGDTTKYTPAQASQFVFTYKLSSNPGATVTVTPEIRDSNNDVVSTVVALPAAATFTASSTNLASSLVLTASSSSLSGTFTLTLKVSGTSATQFTGVSTAVSILSSSSPKPAPTLTAVKFSNSGASLHVLFSAPTNKASISTSTFSCSQLFEFTGASSSQCSWLNGTAVRVVLGTGNTATANDEVFLKASMIHAECAPSVDCSAYPAAARQSVLLSAPDSPVVPIVLLSTPSLVASCDNVTIDPSLSSGSGGRDWSSVKWTAVRADADGLVSAPTVLAALNARGKNLGTPIVLSRSLFAQEQYTVTLTLSNFLGQASSATAIFSIDGNPNLPVVSILGPSVVTMTPASALQLYTSTTQASCAEKASSIGYRWTVYKDGVLIAKPSVSYTVLRYSLLPYTLTAGSVYTIVFEGTARQTALYDAITGRASVTVQVVDGAVQVVLVGGNNRQVPTSGSLTIDASPSYDENVPRNQPSGLTFSWSCTLASAAVFGQSCASVLPTTTNQKILTVDASDLDAALLYQFRVTAVASDGRSASTVVSVQPQLGGSTYTFITSMVTKVNPDNRVSLNGIVRASGYGLDCAWSASVDGVSVPFTALTPLADSFTKVAVRNDFVYPLVVAGNTFLPGSTVTFRLDAHLSGQASQFASFSEISVRVNAPPNGGTLQTSPSNGFALSTVFTTSTNGWTDEPEDFPLTYQFQYIASVSQGPLSLQSRTPSNKVSSNLPAGPDTSVNDNLVTVVCTVFDAALAAATTAATVSVKENVDLNVAQYVTDQLDSFNNVGDVNTVGKLIGNVATTVNKVNCSNASPDFCTQLNREACSVTPQTCGRCLEDYSGVLGDANTICASVRRMLLGAVDDSCTVDDDCLFAKCEDGKCRPPVKVCPSNTADVCSGHGQCEYSTPSGQVLDHACPVTDPGCHARCACEAGYGGKTCGLDEQQLLSQDQIRASLCQAVVTVGENSEPSVQLLGSLFGYLDAAFEADEVVTTQGTAACHGAMRFVGGLVRDNTDRLKEMDASQIDRLIKTASKFIIPKRAGDHSDGSFLHQLMANLNRGILSSMVNGQDAYYYAGDNVRTVVTRAKIGETTSLAPPHTEDQAFYGGGALDSYIEVVGNTTSSPFSDEQGYLAVAVTLWGTNPFPGAGKVQSPLLRVENYNLEDSRRRLAAADAQLEGEHRALSTHEPDFYVVLQLNKKQDFDYTYTLEEATALGVNMTFPGCTNYDGSAYTTCSGCEVSTYTDYNVTFACSVAAARRMLSSDGTPTNQFGSVLSYVDPAEDDEGDGGSSSSTSDSTTLIIAVVVGVGGGLLLIVLGLFFMRSRKSDAAVMPSPGSPVMPPMAQQGTVALAEP